MVSYFDTTGFWTYRNRRHELRDVVAMMYLYFSPFCLHLMMLDKKNSENFNCPIYELFILFKPVIEVQSKIKLIVLSV